MNNQAQRANPTVNPDFIIFDFQKEIHNYHALLHIINSNKQFKTENLKHIARDAGISFHRFTANVLRAIVEKRNPSAALRGYANQIFNTK